MYLALGAVDKIARYEQTYRISTVKK